MSADYPIGHSREATASAATRMIERKMAEAVGIEPTPSDAVAPLAELLDDLRRQLKHLEAKMEAGLKLLGTSLTAVELRLDEAEARLNKIEKFLHVPPDLVEALKNGS